jgi:Tfp pilus assembly protein PilF
MLARLGFRIWLLISISGSTPVLATDVPALVQKAKPAVVEILTYDQQNNLLKGGTGFFISSDGKLLTNYHVISGGSSIVAKTPAGDLYYLKSVVAASEFDDVAELQFLATDVPYLVLGSSSSAVEGQRVLVIGNPEGLEGTVSDGIISAFRAGRSMIQITAPISPGSSGSPVLDESGNVIGIATLVFKEGQNLNLAISAETIRHAIATDYAEMIRQNPGWAMGYYFRGLLYFNLGQYDKAISDINEAIRLEPKSKDAYLYYLNRGRAYANLKQNDKAISDITETIRQKPDWDLAYDERAIVYSNLGQYHKAISDYSEAIRLEPNDPDFYDERAIVFDKLGNHSKAEQDRKKAKELRGRK